MTSVFLGKLLLLIDGFDACALTTQSSFLPGTEEPSAGGAVLRGAHDGFIETLCRTRRSCAAASATAADARGPQNFRRNPAPTSSSAILRIRSTARWTRSAAKLENRRELRFHVAGIHRGGMMEKKAMAQPFSTRSLY